MRGIRNHNVLIGYMKDQYFWAVMKVFEKSVSLKFVMSSISHKILRVNVGSNLLILRNRRRHIR